MKQDGFDRAVARAERAFSKLVRIRDGIEDVDPEDTLGVKRWRRRRASLIQRAEGQQQDRAVQFNRPVTRSYRLTNTAGATSFHIQHRAISKVTHEMNESGLRNRPGAARAHARYVEREVAVASIEPAVGMDIAAAVLMPAIGIDQHHATGITTTSSRITNLEKDHEYDWHRYLGFDPWIARGLVDDLAGPQPGAPGSVVYGAREDADSDAGLWLLSRRDLVRQGRGSHGHLPGAQDLSMVSGSAVHRLPDASSLPQSHSPGGIAVLASAGEAPDHDRYIGRTEAVAIQPDGTRALITNIDPDDEQRARFWSLVEQHEAVASNDQMSLRVNDRPAFWAKVSIHPDCPAELREALGTNTPHEPIRFDIPSGKAMRAFLDKQPGWVKPTTANKTSGSTPFAAFHDGRKGRIQYRVVGELPDELDEGERFTIVREFSAIFERRKMPFVAVMHAPDHHNNEKNWHFHLIYYDRPCRRITETDIANLENRGFKTVGLEPGMWDFTVVTPKRGRTNGKATPIKQKKVDGITDKTWIKTLREELAAITNHHLARAGVERRLDPRRYTEMGIIADPQEHLGTSQAAAETRGERTKIGTANELRQWKAIMAQGDALHRQALADAEERIERYRRSRRRIKGTEAVEQEANMLRDNLHTAAQLDDIAFRVHHGIERVRSRAAHVRQANRQLVQAFDADPAAGRPSEREESQRLVVAATGYLGLLDDRLTDERALLVDCRRDAAALRQQALMIERQRSAAVAPPGATIAAKPPMVESQQPALPTPLDSSSAPETSEATRRAIAAAMAAARSAGR
ncbi:MobA/MobL family protein [Sphingobium sufflavum]|uniref:MobA/MobL family protein n=1 Tax=Sphingobium sufflavum TaxID=1129547 RepID=UPI001F3A3097|nr:MobA/MobL family protein [Sphingobium sufflavum]MCE7797364.1 MobA/MobL family protein [Sphingobium sufflavum]